MITEARACQHCKKSFEITGEDFGFYEKMGVPAPTECPRCRQQHRMIFRNFKTFYKRPSSKSGASMISMYHDKVPFPVYTHSEWWSDAWDAKSYGCDFDFNRPFFEQFKELLDVVPRFALMGTYSQDCEYTNSVYNGKNCYLILGGVDIEDCAYGHIVYESRDCFDSLYVRKSEYCYQCTDLIGCSRLLYCQDSEDCADSIALFDCRSCTNCIGCVGLRGKSYHIFNEPVTKEQYQQFLKEHPLTDPATIKMILEKREELRRSLPQRHFFGSHNTDVSGNHVYNAKNMHYCFDVDGGENCKFVFTSRNAFNCYDTTFSPDMENVYYSLTALKSNNIFFNHWSQSSHDIYYSDSIAGSGNCFGCAGLRNAEYCILNKQYTKEEYEALKSRIIEHMKKTGEWGQFFPVSMSPFAYNESVANGYMPLTKEQALAQGFRWQDDIPSTVGKETIAYGALPKDPGAYSDALLKEILKCSACSRNYKLIPKEIAFYKRIGLPLPDKCPNCRHHERMDARNRRELWPGTCAQCGTAFETSHSPDQQKLYKIYCEKCYQQAMI